LVTLTLEVLQSGHLVFKGCFKDRFLAQNYFLFQSVILPFAAMEAAFFMFKNKVLHVS